MANDGFSEPPRRADSNTSLFTFCRISGPGHLQGPGVSLGRILGGLSIEPFLGGFGTRPWWLALSACGGAYWPLAFEPSAMTSRPLGGGSGQPPPPQLKAPNSVHKGDKAQNPVDAAQLLPHSGRRGGNRTAMHCLSDTHNQGTEMAMKVVRQARLELSGGSKHDLLRPS